MAFIFNAYSKKREEKNGDEVERYVYTHVSMIVHIYQMREPTDHENNWFSIKFTWPQTNTFLLIFFLFHKDTKAIRGYVKIK